MKKLLLLLLFPFFAIGQAEYDNISIIGNVQDTTATRVNVQNASGVINYNLISGFQKEKGYLSTGLLKNGLITINSEPSKYSLTAGVGVITDFSDPDNVTSTIVRFAGSVGHTPAYLTTANITYIAVNASGVIVESASPFTPQQNRSLIILGAVIHSNRTTIEVINNISSPSNDTKNQLSDFMNAVGALNVVGNKFTANGANLILDKTAGTLFKNGSNFAIDKTNPHQINQAQATALTLRYRTQNGTEGTDRVTLSPGLYDLNNILTTVANNRFSIHTVSIFQSGVVRVQYGQNIYTTLDDAEKAINTRAFNVESNIALQGVTRAYIILRGNATSLNDAATSKIIEAQKFGGVTSGGTAVTSAQILAALGFTPEDLANKQNSLTTDGTGVKYPTVDATNTGLALKANDNAVVHLSGLENIVSRKTFTASLTAQNSTTGIGTAFTNTTSGTGIFLTNSNSGTGIIANGETASTGKLFVGQSNGVETSSITKAGVITGSNLSGTNTGDQTLSSLGAAPSSGSGNYIQNGTAQQTANLNISGSGSFGGNVGIGLTNPLSELEVLSDFKIRNPSEANTRFNFGWFNSNSIAYIDAYNFSTGARPSVAIQPDGGNLLIGATTDNGSKLQVAGAATFTSSVTATSHITSGGSATQLVKGDGTLTAGYKVYTALLTQSGTSAPSATVLENTLGGTVVWSRTSTGQYLGTLTGGFVSGKTTFTAGVGFNTGSNNVTIQSAYNTVNNVYLATVLNTAYFDGTLNGSTVEIRVYQ